MESPEGTFLLPSQVDNFFQSKVAFLLKERKGGESLGTEQEGIEVRKRVANLALYVGLLIVPCNPSCRRNSYEMRVVVVLFTAPLFPLVNPPPPKWLYNLTTGLIFNIDFSFLYTLAATPPTLQMHYGCIMAICCMLLKGPKRRRFQ